MCPTHKPPNLTREAAGASSRPLARASSRSASARARGPELRRSPLEPLLLPAVHTVC